MERKTHERSCPNSHISNVEKIGIFNDYVVHVNGVELGEVPRERNKVNGGAFMKLEQVWIASIVPLPSQGCEDFLEGGVG